MSKKPSPLNKLLRILFAILFANLPNLLFAKDVDQKTESAASSLTEEQKKTVSMFDIDNFGKAK